MGVLGGRLAAALELAGALLGAVALQPSAVLPLLRAAAQLLTVDGLATLQVKCIGARTRFPLWHQHGLVKPLSLRLYLGNGCTVEVEK